jgi:hypothetical protein
VPAGWHLGDPQLAARLRVERTESVIGRRSDKHEPACRGDAASDVGIGCVGTLSGCVASAVQPVEPGTTPFTGRSSIPNIGSPVNRLKIYA